MCWYFYVRLWSCAIVSSIRWHSVTARANEGGHVAIEKDSCRREKKLGYVTADWNFNDDVKLTSLVDLWHSQIIQLKCVRVRKPRHFMLLLYMQSWVKREDSPVLNIRWRVQKSINHKFRLLDWLCLIEYRVALFFFTPAGLSFPFVWATHWCVLYIHLYTRHMLLVTQPIVFAFSLACLSFWLACVLMSYTNSI